MISLMFFCISIPSLMSRQQIRLYNYTGTKNTVRSRPSGYTYNGTRGSPEHCRVRDRILQRVEIAGVARGEIEVAERGIEERGGIGRVRATMQRGVLRSRRTCVT